MLEYVAVYSDNLPVRYFSLLKEALQYTKKLYKENLNTTLLVMAETFIDEEAFNNGEPTEDYCVQIIGEFL